MEKEDIVVFDPYWNSKCRNCRMPLYLVNKECTLTKLDNGEPIDAVYNEIRSELRCLNCNASYEYMITEDRRYEIQDKYNPSYINHMGKLSKSVYHNPFEKE